MIDAYLRGDPEIADNALADALGVSKNTVLDVRRRLEESGVIRRVNKTRGKDGKNRPVRYAPRIFANTHNEFKKAKDIINDLPPNCAGKTLDITTAKRLARTGRHIPEFFPTPSKITLALLEREQFVGSFWEPACGKGHIAMLLPENCYASDLYDHGYGEIGIDFLKSNRREDNIVTNPPFSYSTQFKWHALKLARKKVAMLKYCKQLGEEVEARSPLKSVYVFDEKIDFEGADLGWLMAWFVWEIGYDGPITVTRIKELR